MRLKLCFASLLFLLFFSTFHAHNLILQICKKFAQTDPGLSYNFCVNSLEAAPDSQSADLRQLGVISIKLTQRNVTSTRRVVKELMKNKKLDGFVKECLSDCLDLYSEAVSTLKQAMKNYKFKQYKDANIEISSIMDASTTCEDGFKEKNDAVPSPLTERNNDTFQLSAIALTIMDMLS